MAILNDNNIKPTKFQILRPVGKRKITHAIHDIDGTHSLIRDWPPVMGISMFYAMTCGLMDDYDSDFYVKDLIKKSGRLVNSEMDRICRENAGYSAITQLEYGVRRAIQEGNIPEDVKRRLSPEDIEKNDAILEILNDGMERWPHIHESAVIPAYVDDHTPRLFRLYEKVLNGACRDSNTEDARTNPAKWRVPGSLEFITYLRDIGVKNYFVTGAVIYDEGGMREEVEVCGYKIGPGEVIHSLEGSSWDKKMPKDEVMRDIYAREGLVADNVLVVGDGRTEIKAGADMGSVVITRLPKSEKRLRELHTTLGAHYIFEDYTDPEIRKLIVKE